MEETMGSSTRLEDIPELIHRIQLLLPLKEAARTSVFSKSWLHSWNTSPALRFDPVVCSLSEEQNREYSEMVDRTLTRYLRDSIPITDIRLMIDIQNKMSAEKLIQRLATTKSCVNKLFLSISLTRTSFTLPDEILSLNNLTKIRISCSKLSTHTLLMTTHPVINCVSLQKLHLERVHINDEVIHDILSTCSLIEVLHIHKCMGFSTIKVQNLRRLRILSLQNLYDEKRLLEINDVPNLSFIRCLGSHVSIKTYSLRRVTQLSVGRMIMDYTIVDMINSKFPLLKILKLRMRRSVLETLHLTSASMKRLHLLDCPPRLIKVHVNAPKFFYFKGEAMPSLVFPATSISVLQKLELKLCLRNPVDASFFLKLSQALVLSIKCDIKITIMINNVIKPPYIDILNLIRKSVRSPAMNVRQLKFRTDGDEEGRWDLSPFFEALFSICHPIQVVAKPDKDVEHHNYFCKLMESEVMEKKNGEYLNWPYYLKVFETKPEKEETLTSLDWSSRVSVFKLQTKLG